MCRIYEYFVYTWSGEKLRLASFLQCPFTLKFRELWAARFVNRCSAVGWRFSILNKNGFPAEHWSYPKWWATSGFFFVLSLTIWIKNYQKKIVFWNRSNIISSMYRYSLGVGSTPYGKRYISRTKLGNPLRSTRYLKRTLTFTAIFLALMKKQFGAFFKPKYASGTNAITDNTPRPTWKTYEFSRHRCCLTLNFGDNANQSHSDRCHPLTTVKHDPRNAVL